jgi:indolepyruvate ferredoxin oxidoreductase alpha subunit
VAVIGDSTFLHTGINGLMDMVYNRSRGTVVILDNRITAMTGRQENPGSGYTLAGAETCQVDIEALCRGVGVEHVTVVDPYDLRHTREVLKTEMARPAASVVIARRPCMLVKRHPVRQKPALLVNVERCTGCRACLQLGCPAIEWQPEADGTGKARINPLLCCGCGLCRQVCRFEAIGASHDE